MTNESKTDLDLASLVTMNTANASEDNDPCPTFSILNGHCNFSRTRCNLDPSPGKDCSTW
ncbi:MAG: hypothetical protein ACC656_13875 [Candidatus Heimdallarchaeota archaeon]